MLRAGLVCVDSCLNHALMDGLPRDAAVGNALVLVGRIAVKGEGAGEGRLVTLRCLGSRASVALGRGNSGLATRFLVGNYGHWVRLSVASSRRITLASVRIRRVLGFLRATKMLIVSSLKPFLGFADEFTFGDVIEARPYVPQSLRGGIFRERPLGSSLGE